MSEWGSLKRTRSYRKEEASQRCGEGVSEENNEDILVCERACLANEEHGLKLLSGTVAFSLCRLRYYVGLYSAKRHRLNIVKRRIRKKDIYHDLEHLTANRL